MCATKSVIDTASVEIDPNKILSDITVFTKYAKYDELLGRRETWEELVARNKEMHSERFPQLKKDIDWAYEYVLDKKVLPSMRSMQFAGKPIDINEARIFNCSFLKVDHYKAFSETMFLLLSGCGVGYSVQKHHVDQLPAILKPNHDNKYPVKRRYLISDDIEGWAETIKILLKSYFFGTNEIQFDYRGIRQKGMQLVTSGGKAPGYEPLEACVNNIRRLLESKNTGDKLRPIDAHDILCHIANAVLAGGIRRSAMISLFDLSDDDMITCKSGAWWEHNEQRGRANNSVVLERGVVTENDFKELWRKIEASNCGEPGIFWTSDKEMGTNPCFTGEMKLMTPGGERTFKSLAKDEYVELIDKNGNAKEARVWCSGIKPTVKLFLAGKDPIRCTEDHMFMLSDGKNALPAKELEGKRLMPYYTINTEVSEFTKYGFIQGDGSTGRLDSESHKGLEIDFGQKDMDVASVFGYNTTGKQYISGYNDILKALGFSSSALPKRGLPSTYNNWMDADKKMFLKGLYSANGSVITNSRVALKTTCKQLADDVLKELERFGLAPYITTNKSKDVQFSNGNYTCKESYDVNIGKYKDIKWFAANISFVHLYKRQSLEKLILERSPLVTNVKTDGGLEDVYDFSLEGTEHWGVVEDVIAHNCGEIALRTFCNLTEINASNITTQEDFENRVLAAAIIGTMQASYTNFHYLRPHWKEQTEEDSLLGIGLTGIASNAIFSLDIEKAALIAVNVNAEIASRIGIRTAKRITCVKPAGTTSLCLGTSSGVHAWHAPFYLRRMRFNKLEPLYLYLKDIVPELLEDCVFNPTTTAILGIPQKAPIGASLRDESPITLLERVKTLHEQWIKPAHNDGVNTHNVSVTVSIKGDEWQQVGEWMWNNRDSYAGISVLPYDGGTYIQAPFEDITEERYNELIKYIADIDLSQIIEREDNTNLNENVACAGGACEVK